MAKPIKNFILLVDHYRHHTKQRNTAGRYRVGAKTADEARALLRTAIGFGDITVFTEYERGRQRYGERFVNYKEIVQEIPWRDSRNNFIYKQVPPHHATDPHHTYADNIRPWVVHMRLTQAAACQD